MAKIPIVIDCDPGVDDAFAIMLAATSELFDLRAITPVAGNQIFEKVTKNALDLVDALGLTARVAKGANHPLIKPYTRTGSLAHGDSGVGDLILPVSQRDYDEKPAWDVIYEEAISAKGELVLFAVGPLTNVAIALMKYEDLPKYIKKIVIMGGSATFGNANPYAEFNIWIDPHAADIVFRSGIEQWLVGLNATHQGNMTISDFDEIIDACGDNNGAWILKALSVFSKMNAYEKGSDSNIIHDALTVAAVMDPTFAQFEKFYVTCETKSPYADGQTVVDFHGILGKEPNMYVCMKLDPQKFKEMLIKAAKYYAGPAGEKVRRQP